MQKIILPLYQADAFTKELFSGNPAAVVPLREWLPGNLMQKIARENNLSETAFVWTNGVEYEIRWFTPLTEVTLCGHATLAAAHVFFHHLDYSGERITFRSKSGELGVTRMDDLLQLDFPVSSLKKVAAPIGLSMALGNSPTECMEGDSDLLAAFAHEHEVLAIHPDFDMLKEYPYRGIIVTAPGEKCDFVSRFFGPAVGVNEDPVTGSAHTMLTPYWADRLGKRSLTARQVSSRGGKLFCQMAGNRVLIAGHAVTYLSGQITVDL